MRFVVPGLELSVIGVKVAFGNSKLLFAIIIMIFLFAVLRTLLTLQFAVVDEL